MVQPSDNTVLRFSGINNFINNSAAYLGLDKNSGGGGAIYRECDYSVFSFDGINKTTTSSTTQLVKVVHSLVPVTI